MAEAMMLSVGIDNFEKIRKSDFYYIDKTKFFEIGADKELFNGLYITKILRIVKYIKYTSMMLKK